MAKRGPSYPAFGLKQAIEKVRLLHRQDGSAPTAPDVAIQAWGYGSLNGASLRVLAALKQFGLLESAGDNVKLTERALTILLEPDGSAERAGAIQAAATAPSIFGAIIAEYNGDLPSDAALVSYLARKQGFQERAAQQLVEAFRETGELAKESSAPHIAEKQAALAEKVASDVARGAESKRVREAVSATPPLPEGERMEWTWWLSGDAVATFAVSRSLEADDIQTLKSNFENAVKALDKMARKATAPLAPATSEPAAT